jgi:hypothetical protein
MIIYIVAALTVIFGILPVLFILKIPESIAGRIMNFLLTVSLSAFIYNYGGWLYTSLYLKYFFALITVLFMVRYLLRCFRIKPVQGKKGIIHLAVVIPFFIFFTFLNVLYFFSNRYDSESISLNSPFKDGKYIIMQGGSNEINIFHRRSKFSVYSLDVVRLNEFGNRAGGIFPENLNDYAIFGTDVYSPCEGTVIGVINDIEDNTPGTVNQSWKAGNFVLIKSTDGLTLMLAHLKKGSVMVDKDDKVTYGTYIGKAGNSGNSMEPHLHIEAHRKNEGETADPVAIKINGEYLRYNECF